MKVVALVSGGKDSTYNMMQCVAAGHQLVALAHLYPDRDKEELDSAMFQTVGHKAVQAIASAMQLPLFSRAFSGRCTNSNLHYQPADGDEVEDLLELLKDVKTSLPVEAVSVGAILSTYQRVRVESVCQRLGLTCLAYLWQREQKELLEEMVEVGVEAVVIKVAAMGLTTRHLGQSVSELRPVFLSLNSKYDMNVCGEGGEYETFTVNCPLFKKRLQLHSVDKVLHSDDAFAPVAYLSFSVVLEDKGCTENEAAMYMHEPVQGALLECSREPSIQLEWIPNPVPQISFHDHDLREQHRVVIGPFTWLAMDSKGKAGESAEEAIHSILEDMRRQISGTSLSLADVCCVQLYLRHMSDYAAVNAVYCKTFGFNPPVRACVAVPMSSAVCLGCSVVHSGSDKVALRWRRSALHVQSVSHWAPANIGPYSQGVTFGPLLWVSGQIGLVPSSMKLVKGGVFAEGCLALRHVHRVLDVHHYTLEDCMLVTAFVTCNEALAVVFDLWSQQSSRRALLDVVEVTGLPRGAAVEWQALALRENSLSVRHNLCSNHDGWAVRTEVLGSSEHRLLVMRSVLEANSADVHIDGVSLASCFCKAVSSAATVASLPLSPNTSILHAQLFVQDKLPSNQLKSALEHALQDCNVSVSILVVPVVHCREGVLSFQLVLHDLGDN